MAQDDGRPGSDHNRWVHRFALLTAAATFVLVIAGGLVTSTGSGLAVPDWPTTFGYNMFLYPWSKMDGGILVEHGHRLIGAGTGVLTLALALWLWIGGPRWLRWLGVGALALVMVQGILGGLRVIWLERTLAIAHAALAQAFFALIVSLAFFTSREGVETPRKMQVAEAGRLRTLALLTTGVIYLQLIIGAVLRHTAMGVGFHLVCAGVVSIQIFLLAVWIVGRCADQPRLVHPVAVLGALLILQLLVGVGAYLGRFTSLGVELPLRDLVVLTTTHVAIGALMLATGLVLTLRVYRLVAPPMAAIGEEFLPSQSAARSKA